MNSTNLYRDLANVRAQIAQLEEDEKFIKTNIANGLEASDESTVVNEYGKFTLTHSRKYTYSSKITELEKVTKEKVSALTDKVKIAKLIEEQKGAPCSVTIGLTYTAPKPKTD